MEECVNLVAPWDDDETPRSMLCLDLGVIMDAGNTGLGRTETGHWGVVVAVDWSWPAATASLPGMGR